MVVEGERFYLIRVTLGEDPKPVLFCSVLRDYFEYGLKDTKDTVDRTLKNKENLITIKTTLSNVNKMKARSKEIGFNFRIEDIFDL